jgi:hypothetical protein
MRKLLTVGLIAGIAVGITRLVGLKKEWSGLTEPEARAKLDAMLAGKVEDEAKRREFGDKVIEGMRDRGLLRNGDNVSGNGSGAAASTGETTADG